MNFKKHSEVLEKGTHAFLGGSKYHWINYDSEKLISSYKRYLQIQKGVELHSVASNLIRLGIKLPKSNKAFNRYVNDGIGYRMTTEQVLWYSNNAFGTADAICFGNNLLRIHDLKTGITPVSIHQLEVYTALFCLEYSFRPSQIDIQLRIYQDDNMLESSPSVQLIENIMEKIIDFDKKIEAIKGE